MPALPAAVEVIAHRGASREAPENTLAAFARAVALGADGVELDVHRTIDGHLVVHHDPALPTGAGGAPIASLTLASVQAFRVRGERVPTLAEVVALVAGRARIYCELKGAGTVAAAVRLLTGLDGAAVHAFDHRMVREARELAAELPRGILETSYHLDPAAAATQVAARDLWQYEPMIDAALVQAAHSAGLRVVAWTVNDPTRAAQLAACGVDAICTDDVTLIRATLASGSVSNDATWDRRAPLFRASGNESPSTTPTGRNMPDANAS